MSSKILLSQLSKSLLGLIEDIPCCQGTIEVADEDLILFYGKGPKASRIDLTTATEKELGEFTKECDPASFGLNQVDVIEESYRKARKLDRVHFASNFNPERLGLIEVVLSTLLEGHDEDKKVDVELYKLNVYDKGSFFKSHKDTPRSEHMFATLVVVFPTAHEGGALVLRHQGNELRFDSGTILTAAGQEEGKGRSVAYIAFYGDIEHEVDVVQSGHRITLTYNISFARGEGASAGPTSQKLLTSNPGEHVFEEVLARLLLNPSFLPAGGNLGFGLRHQYPISYDQDVHLEEGEYGDVSEFETERKVLPRLEQYLKGWDAIVKRVCTKLGLDAHLRVIYKTKTALVMCESVFYKFEGEYGEEQWKKWGGGKVIEVSDGERDIEVQERVMWVTPMTTYTSVENSHTAYGNDAWLDHTYGNVCLVVKVGPMKERMKRQY